MFGTTSSPTASILTFKSIGTLSFYYHWDDASVIDPYAGGSVPGFPSTSPTRAQQINIFHTRTIGPSAVNELRMNYTRFARRLGSPSGDGMGKVSDFGFVRGGLGIISSGGDDLEGIPALNFNTSGLRLGVPAANWQFNNTYQIADNFSKIIGRHTLKIGGDVRAFQVNMRWRYGQNGTFGFNGDETGNEFADYLLGAPDSFNQASPGYLEGRSKYFGAYVQDSFRLTPSLTINPGFRWEVSQPWFDVQDRIQAFEPGVQSKIYPDAPTGWVFPGDPGVEKGLGPTRWKNFAPRFGIAYSPTASTGLLGKLFGGPGKTSIRAAYRIYYTFFEQKSNNFELGNPPFAQYFQAPTQVYLEEPYKDRRRGQDPGQRLPYIAPKPGDTGFWPKFLPVGSVPGYHLNNELPYAEHFNFTIQRKINESAIVTIGYVHTQGHHLLGSQQANPASAAKCLAIRATLTAQGRASEACGPNGEDSIYNLGNGQTAYGTRQYSVTSGRYLNQGLLDFTSLVWYASWANSNYHALQATLDKSLGSLHVVAAYSFGKSIDNQSGFTDVSLNPFNHRNGRALSAFDIAHNLVVSYNYDLPLVRAFGRPNSSAARWFVDGWQFSGVTRLATGFPIRIRDSADVSLCRCSIDKPNYNGQPIATYDPRDTNGHLYFDTSVFSKAALGTEGNANPRFFHGPGLNNTDFALHKTTKVREKFGLEFRAEFLNAFNHAQFINPQGNINSRATFGVVTSARDPRIGQMALKLLF